MYLIGVSPELHLHMPGLQDVTELPPQNYKFTMVLAGEEGPWSHILRKHYYKPWVFTKPEDAVRIYRKLARQDSNFPNPD